MSFSSTIDVNHFAIRSCSIEDRRFCIEMVHLVKNETITLQADSEEQMIKWVRGLEGCKRESANILSGKVTLSKSNASLGMILSGLTIKMKSIADLKEVVEQTSSTLVTSKIKHAFSLIIQSSLFSEF